MWPFSIIQDFFSYNKYPSLVELEKSIKPSIDESVDLIINAHRKNQQVYFDFCEKTFFASYPNWDKN